MQVARKRIEALEERFGQANRRAPQLAFVEVAQQQPETIDDHLREIGLDPSESSEDQIVLCHFNWLAETSPDLFHVVHMGPLPKQA